MKKDKDSKYDAQAEKDSKEIAIWGKRYTAALDNQTNWFTKVSQWYDILYTVMEDEDYFWHSRVFEPIMTSKFWNIISKTVAGNPGWLVNPVGKKTEEVSARSIAMEELLKYFFNNPELDQPMPEKLIIAIMDAVATGVGYGKVSWCLKDKVSYSRNYDEEGNSDNTQTKKTKKAGYPDFENVSVFDMFIAPLTGNSIQKAPWMIIRSYSPKSDLGDEYKNVSKLKSSPTNDTAQYAHSRNKMLSQDSVTADSTIDVVEKWECFERVGKDIFVTVLGNRSQIIKPRRKLDHWHGKYPIITFKTKPKQGSFIGESIFETNERLVWGINDLTNHYLDAWNMANNPMMLQEESTIVDSYEVAPGNTITYKGTQEPKPFMMPQPAIRSYQGIRDTLAADIEQNTISGYQTGNPMDKSDKTAGTKGGILAIQAAGDDLLEFYRQFFRRSIRELGVMWMQLIQQYLDRGVWVKIAGDYGDDNVEITPDMVQGEFDLALEDTSLVPQNKEFELQKFKAFLADIKEIATMSAESPTPVMIEWENVFRDAVNKYGYKDANRYLLSEEEKQAIAEQQMMEQQMAMEAEMAQAPQTPQTAAPKDFDPAMLPDGLQDALPATSEGGFDPAMLPDGLQV